MTIEVTREGSKFQKENEGPNMPHGRRPPEKPGRAGHGGAPLGDE
jgi:hypothetical protein